MTLDGRAGGATHAVPLNYLHMVQPHALLEPVPRLLL
jgi:hypothetical protein